MKRIALLLNLCLIGMCIPGCVSKVLPLRQSKPDVTRQGNQIILYCGAGIRKPTESIVHAFESETGVKVDCRFGGSGKMFRELAESKEGDLYMAGTYYVDEAEKRDLVTAAQTVCYVRPVILVRKGNPKKLSTVHDLARPGVKIYFVDPTKCQSGIVSETVLTKNNVDMKGIKDNLVRPLPKGKNPIDLIQEGGLDAAIVWDTQASAWADRADIISIPEEQNEAWPVRIALLKFSKHQNHAKKLMDFLTSKKGKTIFQKHRFRVDGPE